MRRAQEFRESTCVVRHVPNGLFAPSQMDCSPPSQQFVRPEPPDCLPRANGLLAPSHRIVRPEPTDCWPRATGLFAPSQQIVHPEPTDSSPRPAGRPDNPPASQARFFWEKRKGNSRLRNRKSKSYEILPSHPLFFWKWEGYFAAQEQKVEFHDFYQICFNFVSENLPRNAIYTFRAIWSWKRSCQAADRI